MKKFVTQHSQHFVYLSKPDGKHSRVPRILAYKTRNFGQNLSHFFYKSTYMQVIKRNNQFFSSHFFHAI